MWVFTDLFSSGAVGFHVVRSTQSKMQPTSQKYALQVHFDREAKEWSSSDQHIAFLLCSTDSTHPYQTSDPEILEKIDITEVVLLRVFSQQVLLPPSDKFRFPYGNFKYSVKLVPYPVCLFFLKLPNYFQASAGNGHSLDKVASSTASSTIFCSGDFPGLNFAPLSEKPIVLDLNVIPDVYQTEFFPQRMWKKLKFKRRKVQKEEESKNRNTQFFWKYVKKISSSRWIFCSFFDLVISIFFVLFFFVLFSCPFFSLFFFLLLFSFFCLLTNYFFFFLSNFFSSFLGHFNYIVKVPGDLYFVSVLCESSVYSLGKDGAKPQRDALKTTSKVHFFIVFSGFSFLFLFFLFFSPFFDFFFFSFLPAFFFLFLFFPYFLSPFSFLPFFSSLVFNFF